MSPRAIRFSLGLLESDDGSSVELGRSSQPGVSDMFVGPFTYCCGLITVFGAGDLVEHCPVCLYNAVYSLADDQGIFYCIQLGIDLRTVVAVYLVTNLVDNCRLVLANQILQMSSKSCRQSELGVVIPVVGFD